MNTWDNNVCRWPKSREKKKKNQWQLPFRILLRRHRWKQSSEEGQLGEMDGLLLDVIISWRRQSKESRHWRVSLINRRITTRSRSTLHVASGFRVESNMINVVSHRNFKLVLRLRFSCYAPILLHHKLTFSARMLTAKKPLRMSGFAAIHWKEAVFFFPAWLSNCFPFCLLRCLLLVWFVSPALSDFTLVLRPALLAPHRLIRPSPANAF